MNIKKVSPRFSVVEQISAADLGAAAAQGIKTIICNRPDDESQGQPSSSEIASAAENLGMSFLNIPVKSGSITDQNIEDFERAYHEAQGPILAYCRTGTRSVMLWALAEVSSLDIEAVLSATKDAGFDLTAMRPRLRDLSASPATAVAASEDVSGYSVRHDIIIVGGGAGGLGVASSLLRRKAGLDILVIEPSDTHYYQPGFTLVGSGTFDKKVTKRTEASVMPKGVTWKRAAVAAFEPENSGVILEDGEKIAYGVLVVAAGLKLDWDAVDGLSETLGKNGVTSNYSYELAPYTWELVQGLKSGRAIFTQPAMPIKCAGAPQKAMYLSSDHWFRTGALKDINVEFRNAGGVLFGVADYVPALMKYVDKYSIDLCLNENLVAVDGPAKKAWFDRTNGEGETSRVETDFDMMHVCPPQTAPDFIRQSPLANDAGWVDVAPDTLQHVKYGNVFSIGDVCSAPNAKTAAAVRKQAPVAAVNIVNMLDGKTAGAEYDGYGSCPLTVERGKIVLAEFGYGGKHLPTFPQWVINSFEPSRLAWFMKERMMPGIYFDMLLKGRELLAAPNPLKKTD
jgi:sulfide:quinone oxidoreductase